MTSASPRKDVLPRIRKKEGNQNIERIAYSIRLQTAPVVRIPSIFLSVMTHLGLVAMTLWTAWEALDQEKGIEDLAGGNIKGKTIIEGEGNVNDIVTPFRVRQIFLLLKVVVVNIRKGENGIKEDTARIIVNIEETKVTIVKEEVDEIKVLTTKGKEAVSEIEIWK